MSLHQETFCGTIDLFADKNSVLPAQNIAARQKQQCSFVVMGAEVSSPRGWDEWQAQVKSFWTSECRTIPAAIITEKTLNPGPMLALPDKFRILLIPCFSSLPIELPYLELFSFVRNHGGLVALLPPLATWESQISSLNGVDLFTCMINGQEHLSTALYHLNRHQKLGFIGINQLDEGVAGASFIWLSPNNYKFSEYDLFRCFSQSSYALSNSHKKFIKLKTTLPADRSEPVGSELLLTLASNGAELKSELWKNGRKAHCQPLSGKPATVTSSINGKTYFFLKTDDAGVCSITAPLFACSPHQLWGDHHVHYINRHGLDSSRMDYIVYGLYGQVNKYEDFPNIVPGGEIHGTTNRGKPDNLHFLIVQQERKAHAYSWEPGEGNEQTLKRAQQYGDFSILAHPALEGEYLFAKQALTPDGIEILHGFSLFAAIIGKNSELRSKVEKASGLNFSSYLQQDAVKVATELWDTILSSGKRCLGIGNGDLHGPGFHGLFANNMGNGVPVTVINAANAVVANVNQYLQVGDVWCADSGFLRLELRVNGKTMGSQTILQKNNKIEIEAESSFAIVEMVFISQGKEVHRISCDAHGIHETFMIPGLELDNYLRVELIDEAGHRAFGNPVYF
ncbi:MAG: hypothetical protein L3J71_14450 [Victivallaceae bacterium]|nr:hypothetical protein [Victivallaceae bacterium]